MDIAPIPGKHITPEHVAQLKADLELLFPLFTQEVLGKRMGLHKSNFNKYVKGSLRITRTFLKNFYAAWGDILRDERTNQKTLHDANSPIQTYYPARPKKEIGLADIIAILERIEEKIDHLGPREP